MLTSYLPRDREISRKKEHWMVIMAGETVEWCMSSGVRDGMRNLRCSGGTTERETRGAGWRKSPTLISVSDNTSDPPLGSVIHHLSHLLLSMNRETAQLWLSILGKLSEVGLLMNWMNVNEVSTGQCNFWCLETAAKSGIFYCFSIAPQLRLKTPESVP